MIPSGFIQDLLTRVDILDIVGRHVELKRAGINHKGLCPFHGEKTPSFIVSPSRQTYHCFGCGVHGDALRFLTEFTGLSFVEAVRDLAQQVGMVVPDDDRSPQEREAQNKRRAAEATLCDVLGRAGRFYKEQLKASGPAVAYLKGRGLTGEIAARYGIGYAPDSWRPLSQTFAEYDDPLLEAAGLVIQQEREDSQTRRYDRFRNRIMFPIRSVQGEVIGFGGRVMDHSEPKYLNSPETPVFIKGRELYGLYEARTDIRKAGHALVVEGYMDVVALAQWGVGQAVATLGTACTEDHVRKLLRFTENLVFSFDGDAAGRKAAERALLACLPHASDTRSIRFLFLPPEHDPDSYIREHGAQAFRDRLDAAVPLSSQMLTLAQAGCELATPEGRARLVRQAQGLWSALPDGALKLQMLREFARAAAVPVQELEWLWRQASGRSTAREGPATDDGARPSETAGHGQRAGDRTRRDFNAPSPPHRSTWQERQAARDPLRKGAAAPSLRQAPRSPADRATQLLLRESQWWHRLGPDDLGQLQRLGEPHATLLRWLERTVENDGPRPWAVLQRNVSDDPELAAAWRRLPGSDSEEAEPDWSALRSALDALQRHELQSEMTRLAPRVDQDPAALARYRELFERLKALKNATEPDSGGG